MAQNKVQSLVQNERILNY